MPAGKTGAMRRKVPDVRTLTAGELQREQFARRRHRYFAVIGACLALTVFAFFCTPAPLVLRLVAAGLAAVLAPAAALVGNRNPFSGL